MTRAVYLGGRVYTLHFSLRSILHTQEIAALSLTDLWKKGAAGLSLLLFCALRDHHPAITPRTAAALVTAAAHEDTLPALTDALFSCYAASALADASITQEDASRLLLSAAQAGYPQPDTLLSLSPCEISRALDAFTAGTQRQMRLIDLQAYLTGAYLLRALRGRYPAAPDCIRPAAMTDQQMKSALRAFAERSTHEHS